ncbi:hypothetical protein C3L23_03325 [Nautilia sp. PV-1]|uniref:DUF488 domain-containing protein n=1 Tax=Nautilia sp. PV-1 TaxID=2579250 RepID=UPI000FDAB7A3|nr:DUF488 domain-containing protein [Nautilia sp. PV-1]AZV46334.1 hypothetical protein C3L23_03325 [Nautilia sp. PV-1]
MKLFTIGFSGKSAEEFFNLLTRNNIQKVIDIRLNNKSQLAGFTNIKHFPYFLKLHGIKYEHNKLFFPTEELLKNYKNKKITWEEYENIFLNLLKERKIEDKININDFENAVLLCSEKTADKCHRRLSAEYLKKFFNIEIIHL